MPPTDDELRLLVVQACRVLQANGQEHFFLGHVSARAPGAERIWIKPAGLGLGEIEPDDVVACDLDGRPLTPGGRPLHNEVPIHTEIYRRRDDVTSVVHTHPFHAASWSAAAAGFAILGQDGVLFADGIGRYPHAPLVVTKEQGAEVAGALGNARVVVLKNHGIAAVGTSVAQAVFVALSFERAIRMQIAATQLGPLVPMSEDEVAAMRPVVEPGGARLEAMWAYLLRDAGLAARQDRPPPPGAGSPVGPSGRES